MSVRCLLFLFLLLDANFQRLFRHSLEQVPKETCSFELIVIFSEQWQMKDGFSKCFVVRNWHVLEPLWHFCWSAHPAPREGEFFRWAAVSVGESLSSSSLVWPAFSSPSSFMFRNWSTGFFWNILVPRCLHMLQQLLLWMLTNSVQPFLLRLTVALRSGCEEKSKTFVLCLFVSLFRHWTFFLVLADSLLWESRILIFVTTRWWSDPMSAPRFTLKSNSELL